MFTTTDIRNRINKYNSEIHGDENDIIKDGGNVAAKYDENKRVGSNSSSIEGSAGSQAKPLLY